MCVHVQLCIELLEILQVVGFLKFTAAQKLVTTFNFVNLRKRLSFSMSESLML